MKVLAVNVVGKALTLASGLARISSDLTPSPFAAALTNSSLMSPVIWVSNSFFRRADNLSKNIIYKI